MSIRLFDHKKNVVFLLLCLAALFLSAGCNSTKYLPAGQYLLRENKVVLKTDGPMPNKGEIKDNISRLIVQKPNSYFLDVFPIKIGWYNVRYKKLHNKPDTSLPKSVERPVAFDSAAFPKSMQNIKSYLFNQGYFYARVQDTVVISGRKATAVYTIDAGKNYVINKTNFNVDDSNVLRLVRAAADESRLEKEKPFAYILLEEERSRLTAMLRNNGYYRFTQENITFKIDTLDKRLFKHVESPFENAINFISSAKSRTKPLIDIDIIIRLADDTLAYKVYTVGAVNVYPDYRGVNDLSDTTMIKKTIDGVNFKYHNEYVHPKVLFAHIYLNPGSIYSQADYNKTHVKLNELGIFQYIHINPRQNRQTGILNYDVFLNRAKKHDFSVNYEFSRGTTYDLGNSIGANFRDRNFLKGANLLTFGVSGGVEWAYNNNPQSNFFEHFNILTRYGGVNASIDFPKFLAPIASSLFDNSNLPHTIIGAGANLIERVNYFTLVNTRANFSYSWRQTQTKTWVLSPAFINVIHLPVRTDSFKKILDSNVYLRNSYKENFIEGESISFVFDDNQKKRGINYSYLKLGLEEAGSLLGAVNQVGVALRDLYKIDYAEYIKFDFDARHYFTLRRSVFACRFSGGIGVPYGKSQTLPYIKQYYAGGPYSLRGWRIRTLGPGNYYIKTANTSQIDRTGDIKLELNGEYRFPITPLFAGLAKMNGAFFADAGNIWLTKRDLSYPGGEFNLATLGQDIAADIGAGARFDILSFITLRIDAAVQVKKPYVHENSGWVFNKLDFYDTSWRSENLSWFITIGYPF
jgi:outer membrane protein insertion porin family